MDRQKTIIYLTKLKRYSKQINHALETSSSLDFSTIAPEIQKVKGWGDEILVYLRSNPHYDFVKEMLLVDSVNNINHQCLSCKLEAELLEDFNETIDNLHNYAETYQKQYKRGAYKNLIEEFAYKEAKDVYIRMQNAGFIDENLKLSKTTTKVQAYVLGWSIIHLLDLPKRKSWSVIEKQLGCGRIGNITLPEHKAKEIDKVKAVFPELDYSSLFHVPSEKYFKTKCNVGVQMEVFLALVTHGFISKKTKFEDYQKIFGIGSIDIHKPVVWIKSIRLLTYFVYHAFGKNNSNYLEITRYCFSIKGKPLNRGTLKSSISFVIHTEGRNGTHVGLKELATKLAVNCESFN